MLTNRTNAFTLVELLVVIAIISVLAALLLPSLQKAVLEARLISCMNQKRQIALAYQLYQQDFNDYMIGPVFGQEASVRIISSTNQAQNLGSFLALGYLGDAALLFCPDHSLSGKYRDLTTDAVRSIEAGSPTFTSSEGVTTTITINAPSAWPAVDPIYPMQTIPNNSTPWWNKVNVNYPYVEGIACRIDGNINGGKLYWPSGTNYDWRVYARRSPAPLSMCALPKMRPGWTITDGVVVHDNQAFTILFADGVARSFHMQEDHPYYTNFFYNGAAAAWMWHYVYSGSGNYAFYHDYEPPKLK